MLERAYRVAEESRVRNARRVVSSLLWVTTGEDVDPMSPDLLDAAEAALALTEFDLVKDDRYSRAVVALRLELDVARSLEVE